MEVGPVEIFAWILSQGGAMTLTHVLMEKVRLLREIKDMFWKRAASFAIAGAVACVIFVGAAALEYEGFSLETGKALVRQLLSVATLAIPFSQLLHAAKHKE